MNETYIIERLNEDRIDELEAMLLRHPNGTGDGGPVHTFTDGMYARALLMNAGEVIVSKIHKKQHQYVMVSGSAYIRIDGKWEYIKAPYHGTTEPRTRRVLVIDRDCIWLTFHPTNKITVEEVEDEIIEKHENKFLDKLNN